MSSVDTEWNFNEIPIRRWPNQGMVSITDIWKAAGSPASMRPDKWFKSDLIQEKLETFAILVSESLERDKNNKLVKVSGVLEVVKGGRYMQGTFVSYDLAIDYTELLDKEVHKWFIGVLPNGQNEDLKEDFKSTSSNSSVFIDFEDFGGKVRFTSDGRVSVYDAIAFSTGHKNPHDVWSRLQESHSEVLVKCENFQFPGRGQRETPVATLQVFLEILVILPGRFANTVREQAVTTLIRAMNGDSTLVEEILARIKDPQILKDLEESVKSRRIKAYGLNELSFGILSNPLVELTPEIKKGYGWIKKLPEMENLLTELATHVGDMVIERSSPHRSYDAVGKARSREIPLTIRSLKNLETLHIYIFQNNYVDAADVIEVFQKRAYPELAYRDFVTRGVKFVIAHLVSPAGITVAGCERLKQIQKTLDEKYQGSVVLDAMRLDELVWGVMYPAIEERYCDSAGKFGWHTLNRKIKKMCIQLCQKVDTNKALVGSEAVPVQLSIFGELLSINK